MAFLPLTHFEDRPNGSLAAITRDHYQHRQSVASPLVFDLFIKAIHVLAASHLGKELGSVRTGDSTHA